MRAPGRPRAALAATLLTPRAFAASKPREVRRARLEVGRHNGCGALVLTESYFGTGRVTVGSEGVPGRAYELDRDEARALGLALIDFAIRGDLSAVPLATTATGGRTTPGEGLGRDRGEDGRTPPHVRREGKDDT